MAVAHPEACLDDYVLTRTFRAACATHQGTPS
jgi:hypothetical protein